MDIGGWLPPNPHSNGHECGFFVYRGSTGMDPFWLTENDLLAIDPGSTHSAYVILRGETILAKAKVPNDRLCVMLQGWCPNRVVCEVITSYGMGVGASVFETCMVIGRFMEIVKQHGKLFELIPRISVKVRLCSQKAKDSDIRLLMLRMYGLPGTKKSPGPTYGFAADMWAALAVATAARLGGYKPYIPAHERPKKPRKPREKLLSLTGGLRVTCPPTQLPKRSARLAAI